ncbi:NAD(P)/FAD-dependent oxidoreductase [Ideonella sp. BN130291]|uniref:NAD(P)/FAD-dependent oxidoreductase n=1 Tax=Ideonella sp. BN130291 TaxID=3112940 RepID=UPI002E2648BB|nr:FAD-dependent oxidoreductase [Ideonella sp. BN130291]
MAARTVAIVGSGVAGLGAAHALAPHARVTVYEAGRHFGGHAHTVDITLEGQTHGVDTGFLVFNERTYPELIRLFGSLAVRTAPSDMSFSVQAGGLEWSGSTLNSVFAQRRNLLRPGFWRMLADLLRFNRLATALAQAEQEARLQMPIGDFLQDHRFSKEFREGYFLPMVASIWSCPTEQMLHFPIGTLIRFCHNHGLLQVNGRPPWHTVQGGSRQYVQALVSRLPDTRLNTPVRRVERLAQGGVRVHTDGRSEDFDDVVLACHSDQSLALLPDASAGERALLGAVRYHPNRAVLHTDSTLLPRRRLAWAAWNYERAASTAREEAGVCLHYLINRLQPLPWRTPVIVSLNPVREPRPGCVLGEYAYEHPVFDAAAIAAQRQLHTVQGVGGLWYCGAWTRYGFHEDGLRSGLMVAEALLQRESQAPARAA